MQLVYQIKEINSSTSWENNPRQPEKKIPKFSTML